MILVLPIRTSIRPWRTPYANYALIIINVLIFLLQSLPATRRISHIFMLIPVRPALWQFVSYAFLHGSLGHIIGNMFFLYLFGNNVNDKLGHIGYLCFYLAGAVFSGIGHTLMSANPVLGASGAVAAVTGAYLVLFPQTLVTVFYWLLFFMDTFEVSALYFIGFKLIFWDNIIERSIPNVAYDAHLSGYAFGIVSILLMLAAGLVNRSQFDLWSMLKQWDRRRRYRDTVSAGYDPFAGRVRAKKIKVKEIKKTAVGQQSEEKIRKLRDEINRRIADRNLPAAAQSYLELMDLDNNQLPPCQYLLDIANQLASENKHIEAARAYEKFLAHYDNYEYREQVELMLGIIYSRYLKDSESAIKHLTVAVDKLTDPGQLKMCREELEKLQK